MKISEIEISSGRWEVVAVDNWEDVEKLRPIWMEMQGREPTPSVYADIDAYISMYHIAEKEIQPYIIVMKCDGHPHVMSLSYIMRSSISLKFGYATIGKAKLKCLTMMYGGILGELGEEESSLLINQLKKTFLENKVDVIFFNHIKTESSLFSNLTSNFSLPWRRSYPQKDAHWIMRLPETIDAFYQSLSKKHRGNLRRYIRKLEQECQDRVEFITYCGEHEVSQAIEDASVISEKTYQYSLGCKFAEDVQTRNLLMTAARRGWLRISIIYVDSKPCVFLYALHYGKKYFIELMGFDPAYKRFNPGTVLFLKILEKACEAPDVEVFDFGFGDAEYKVSYCNTHWDESSFYLVAPRWLPVCINFVQSILTIVSLLMTYILHRVGLLNWVKRKWRDTLQTS